MMPIGRPCLVTLEMTVKRQQPDGSEAVEVVTVKQEYDAAGNPVGSQTEVKETPDE